MTTDTIDCLSEITGLHYEIEMDGTNVTITWTDADGIEQTVDSIAPGGVLAACDVPAEDQAILCEEVARLAGFLNLPTESPEDLAAQAKERHRIADLIRYGCPARKAEG